MDEEFRICGKTSSIFSQILQNLRRLNWVLEMAKRQRIWIQFLSSLFSTDSSNLSPPNFTASILGGCGLFSGGVIDSAGIVSTTVSARGLQPWTGLVFQRVS
ncbi:hypothetical protein SDJN03_09821, partial [Cucurbita argyrosperma subsp. sororia]